MTGIPGTRRLASRDDTLQARMWAWMRSRRKPWTVADLTGATGASGRAARRYVERLAQAAYLASLDGPDPDADGEDSRLREGGAYVARRWHLARDTGPRAPILVGGSGGDTVADGNGGMTGAALAALRREMGLSLAAFCQVIDVRDARTVRRYERMDRVPTIVVDHIAAWRARPGVAQRTHGPN